MKLYQLLRLYVSRTKILKPSFWMKLFQLLRFFVSRTKILKLSFWKKLYQLLRLYVSRTKILKLSFWMKLYQLLWLWILVGTLFGMTKWQWPAECPTSHRSLTYLFISLLLSHFMSLHDLEILVAKNMWQSCDKPTPKVTFLIITSSYVSCGSCWPRGLRRGSAAARLLGLRFRILRGHGYVCLLWMLCVVR